MAHRMYCLSPRRGLWACPGPCGRRLTVAPDGTVTVIQRGLVKALHYGVLDGEVVAFGLDQHDREWLRRSGIDCPEPPLTRRSLGL